MLSSLCTVQAIAQTFQSDLINLGKQNAEWMTNNAPNLLIKSPLRADDLNPAHLSNPLIPNQVERDEINKSMQQRDRYFSEYAKIVRRYIKPTEAAEALIKNTKDGFNRTNTFAIQLRDGRINFGQYNQEKQKIISELNSNGNLIVQKYDLKTQMSSSPANQQGQAISSATVQGQRDSEQARLNPQNASKAGPYLELQCKQYPPRGPHGQLIEIDCANKLAVANAIKAAAQRLKSAGGIAGQYYKDCYKGFIDAMDPDLPMQPEYGATYIVSCNQGLYEMKTSN